MRSGSETASTPTSTVTDPHLSAWLLVLGPMEITLAIRARAAGRRVEDRELHPV